MTWLPAVEPTGGDMRLTQETSTKPFEGSKEQLYLHKQVRPSTPYSKRPTLYSTRKQSLLRHPMQGCLRYCARRYTITGSSCMEVPCEPIPFTLPRTASRRFHFLSA